jgi:hypothetical protein
MKTINNYIQQDYCSHRVSKALKEHGFDVAGGNHYDENGNALSGRIDNSFLGRGQFSYSYEQSDLNPNECLMPTHAIALKWIYINFKIQLFLDYTYYDGFHYGYKWVKANGDYGIIWKDNDDNPSGCDTAFEATEFAIEYTFKNLINGN